jgi:hypothetical protein
MRMTEHFCATCATFSEKHHDHDGLPSGADRKDAPLLRHLRHLRHCLTDAGRLWRSASHGVAAVMVGEQAHRQHHRHGRPLTRRPPYLGTATSVAVVLCFEDAMRDPTGSRYDSEAAVALDALHVLSRAPGVSRLAVDDQWDQLDALYDSRVAIHGVRAVGGVILQGRRLYPDMICEMDDEFAAATGIRILVVECKASVDPSDTRSIAQACDYARSTTHSGRAVDAVILLPVDLRWHREGTRQAELLAHHSGVWYGQLHRPGNCGVFSFRAGAVSIASDREPPSRLYQPAGVAISCETLVHGGNYTTRLLFTETSTIVVPRFCRRKRGSR